MRDENEDPGGTAPTGASNHDPLASGVIGERGEDTTPGDASQGVQRGGNGDDSTSGLKGLRSSALQGGALPEIEQASPGDDSTPGDALPPGADADGAEPENVPADSKQNPSKPKKFASRKLDWYDMIAQDKSISPTAFRVAYVIGQHINERSGTAWPSLETIGKKSGGITARSAGTHVRKLKAAGYLTVESYRGPGQTSLYSMAWPSERKNPSYQDRKNPSDQTNDRPEDRSPDAVNGSSASSDRKNRSVVIGSALPTEPVLPEHVIKHLQKGRANSRDAKEGSISFFKSVGKNGVGSTGFGKGAVTIADPKDRIVRFQSWLAAQIGPNGWESVGVAWATVTKACDDSNPECAAAVEKCKVIAKNNGKGWPRNWPKSPDWLDGEAPADKGLPVATDVDGAALSAAKLDDRDQNALAALAELTIRQGQPVPDSFGLSPSPMAVKVGAWRAEMKTRGIIPEDDPEQFGKFYLIELRLITKKMVTGRRGWVWPIQSKV